MIINHSEIVSFCLERETAELTGTGQYEGGSASDRLHPCQTISRRASSRINKQYGTD